MWVCVGGCGCERVHTHMCIRGHVRVWQLVMVNERALGLNKCREAGNKKITARRLV